MARRSTPDRDQIRMIAEALEMDIRLLPHAAELLQDLEPLGGNPELIVGAMESVDLGRETRVVDLGCGKGATSIAVAQRLEFEVFGIDLFAPFIDHARNAADHAGVSDLCRFAVGDILSAHEDFPDDFPTDVVIFAAIGDVLGTHQETAGILRRLLRPGGYFVIADDFVQDAGSSGFPDYEDYGSRAEMTQRFISHGDRLVYIAEESYTDILNREGELDEKVRRRALDIAERNRTRPAIYRALVEFTDKWDAEGAFLQENMVSAVWVVERSA